MALYTLHRNYLGDDSENNTTWAVERGTDIVMTNGGTGNFYGIYDPNHLKPSASQVSRMWTRMYQIIGRCNEIIAAGAEMEQTPALKKTIAEGTDEHEKDFAAQFIDICNMQLEDIDESLQLVACIDRAGRV